MPQTKYPLVFAHGLNTSDRVGPFRAWGRVPAFLREQGYTVYLGAQDAWGTLSMGAEQLARVVDLALTETGAEKVNLIGHSKGGLESRLLISSMGYADRVASLSMLCTPNRGAAIVDRLLGLRPLIAGFAFFSDFYWRRLKDERPDAARALHELSSNYLAEFNEQNPDAEGVYYQSWGARLGEGFSAAFLVDGAMALTDRVFYQAASDGLVTEQSARWGHYRGTINGASHQHLCDVWRRDTSALAVCGFFAALCEELCEMGF